MQAQHRGVCGEVLKKTFLRKVFLSSSPLEVFFKLVGWASFRQCQDRQIRFPLELSIEQMSDLFDDF